MAYPGIGGPVKAVTDTGLETDIPHENKERYDRKAVGRENLPYFSAHYSNGCYRIHNPGKAQEPDQRHGKAHRHVEEKHHKKQRNYAKDADSDWIH